MGQIHSHKSSDGEFQNENSAFCALGLVGSEYAPVSHVIALYIRVMQLRGVCKETLGFDVFSLPAPDDVDSAKFEAGGLIYQLWVLYNRGTAAGSTFSSYVRKRDTGNVFKVSLDFKLAPSLFSKFSLSVEVCCEDSDFLDLTQDTFSLDMLNTFTPDDSTVKEDLKKFLSVCNGKPDTAPYCIDSEVHETKHTLSLKYDFDMELKYLNSISDWFVPHLNEEFPAICYYPEVHSEGIDIAKNPNEWLDIDTTGGRLLLSGTTDDGMLIADFNFEDKMITFTADSELDILKMKTDALAFGVARV